MGTRSFSPLERSDAERRPFPLFVSVANEKQGVLRAPVGVEGQVFPRGKPHLVTTHTTKIHKASPISKSFRERFGNEAAAGVSERPFGRSPGV